MCAGTCQTWEVVMDWRTATVGAGVPGPHIPGLSADASVRRDKRGAMHSGCWTPRLRSATERSFGATVRTRYRSATA